MRITEKRKTIDCDYIALLEHNAIVEKLGQLEDIEELCEKIVSQPIYKKFINTGTISKKNYIGCYALYNFKDRSIDIYDDEFINSFGVEDYGKTWALTKEELL